jgi:hypothetical protein
MLDWQDDFENRLGQQLKSALALSITPDIHDPKQLLKRSSDVLHFNGRAGNDFIK